MPTFSSSRQLGRSRLAPASSSRFHGWKNVDTPGGVFRPVTVWFKAQKRVITVLFIDLLSKFKLKLSYFCWILVLQGVLLSFSFISRRYFWAMMGCTCMLTGRSRTIKILIIHPFSYCRRLDIVNKYVCVPVCVVASGEGRGATEAESSRLAYTV